MGAGRLRRLRLALAGSLLLLMAWLQAAPAGATVKVLLRYDDYSSFQTDPRVIAFERALFEGVGQAGGHLIVGVIPFPAVRHPEAEPPGGSLPLALRDDKRMLLKRHVEAGTVTVALHGFNHGNNHRVAGTASEFGGLSEDRQRLLLAVARRSLREAAGLDARIFVPPFNQHDEATLRALAATGFELLSSGYGGAASDALSLRYLPETVHPQRMRRIVEAAVASGRTDLIVVPTLHPYDFVDAGEPMPGFRNDGPQLQLAAWLDDLRAVAALPGVQLVTPKQLLDGGEDLSAARLRLNEALHGGFITRHALVPAWTRLEIADGLLYGAAEARRLLLAQWLWFGALAAASIALSGMAVRWALGRWDRARSLSRHALAGLGLAGVMAVLMRAHFAGLYMASGLAVCVGLGVALGAAADLRQTSEPDAESKRAHRVSGD